MNYFLNPTTPFNAPIPGGVQPGKLIMVKGFTPNGSNGFTINLLCGPMGDVALQISPRFDRNCVVRNSIQNMQMGYEESYGTMPIQRGQHFELLILCDPQNFKIAFNGQHFAEFNHRLPYSAITNLSIDEKVVLSLVSFDLNHYGNRNIGMVIPPSTNYGPPGSGSQPYPTSGMPMTGAPYPYSTTNYSGLPYPQNNPAYPSQTGHGNQNSLYPQMPVGNNASYPANGGFPTSQTPHQQPYGGHSPKPHKSGGLLDKAGMAVAGVLGTTAVLGGHKNKLGALGEKLGAAVATATALTDHLNPKKAIKKQMKAHKKALKYGLPLAGAGLGAYALHKGFHGFRRSSSSSSSSSD